MYELKFTDTYCSSTSSCLLNALHFNRYSKCKHLCLFVFKQIILSFYVVTARE